MKIRFLILALMIGIAVPAFTAGNEEATGTVDPATLKGELIYLEGEVFINGVEAAIGHEVNPGDQISTGPASVADIAFGTLNALEFGENTDAVIEASWGGVDMRQGTMGAVVEGLARLGIGGKNPFTVTTETAVMGVRGTVFFVRYTDEDGAYQCSCNGEVHTEAPDGSLAIDNKATHHSANQYIRTAEGVIKTEVPSNLLYHDDAMMDAIASRIGYTIPWGK